MELEIQCSGNLRLSCESISPRIESNVLGWARLDFTKHLIRLVFLIDWRKAEKDKIHRIYDEYRKPIFPWEIQASKLDECTQRPLGI